MDGFVHVLDPRAERCEVAKQLPVLDLVEGKTVAILSNGWTSMDRLAHHFGALLQERYGVAKVIQTPIPISTAMDEATLESTVKQADFAILGLAN